MNRHPDTEEAIRRGQLCPYCGKDTVYHKTSDMVYRQDYGPIWMCAPCQAWVGVHHAGRRALGRVANAELRFWKKMAHDAFDPLWKRKVQYGIRKDAGLSQGRNYKQFKNACRNAAYAWLTKAMELPPEHAHIGMFTVEQCKKVIALCEPFLQPRKPELAT